MSSKTSVSPDNSETNNSQVVVSPTSEVLSPTNVEVSQVKTEVEMLTDQLEAMKVEIQKAKVSTQNAEKCLMAAETTQKQIEKELRKNTKGIKINWDFSNLEFGLSDVAKCYLFSRLLEFCSNKLKLFENLKHNLLSF